MEIAPPLQDENQMAEHWDKLQTLSPIPEDSPDPDIPRHPASW
jgi:hypothetical protein